MINDKKLREILQIKITQINNLTSTVMKEICNLMSQKYNVRYGDTVDIFNGTTPVEFLDYNMLYKLTVCIREVCSERWDEIDISDLSISKYFTELDKTQFDIPLPRGQEDKDIIIKNYLKVADDYYIAVINIDQIYEWRNLNKIKYNENTQKNLLVKESKGVVIRVLRIIKQAIESITGLMSNNEFITDDITINVNPELYPDCVREERNNLIIDKEAVIDLIDGMHQYISMTEVKDLNPDWDYNAEVRIVTFNEEKANRYILQRNNKNHLTEEEKIEKNRASEANFIINRLNDSHSFILKGTMTDKLFVINKILNRLFEIDKVNRNETHIQTRQKSIHLANIIEANINWLVEENNIFKEFSKEMWFTALYIIYTSHIKGIDFKHIINNINFNELSERVNFKNAPVSSNYKLMSEVMNDVL